MTITDAELSALLDATGPRPDAAPDDVARRAALARREERRAYDGAPPTVPHPIAERGQLPCLTCHQMGFQLEAAHASAISHETLLQCTQCHVSSVGPFPPDMTRVEGRVGDVNFFIGLAATPQGTRAWFGAPPTIPHTTWMRSQCASCHALQGHQGIQTSHPERQSCVQCHAPSASLDQPPHGAVLPGFPPQRPPLELRALPSLYDIPSSPPSPH
jgi:cytochrome c-type protein NapB